VSEEPSIRRRLAAILAADIAGYSRLMGQDEAATVRDLKGHQAVILPLVGRHGGRIIDTAGDGILAEFPSVIGATACAVEIQTIMAARNADVPEHRRMRFRIGINLGDVIHDETRIYGDGINVAARLEGLADPAAVLVSGAVYDQVRDRLDLAFEDLGERELKNIARPVRVYRVRAPAEPRIAPAPGDAVGSEPAGGAYGGSAARTPMGKAGEAPSIAVLPFANMSNDPDQEYFADGMVEDILTALSRFTWLAVIARNSTFTYKGRAVDVRQVATELSVRYVLEGSVRRAARRVRITGQLIDATTGAHLWAERFDGDLEDIFDLQDRITEGVVGAIEPRIRKAEIERSRRKRPESLDAYDLYLRALPHVYAMRPDDNSKALQILEQAISLDPGFAAAFAYAAWCYEQRVVRGWPTARDSDIERGVKLARAAIATGSDDANAIVTAGFVLVMLGRDYDAGLAAVRRALDLNRNSAIVSILSGWANNFAGNLDEALTSFQRAQRLSPSDPGAFFFVTGAAMSHLLSGRYAEAAEVAARSAATYADWDTTYWVLAPAYVHLDQIDRARAAVAKLLLLTPGATVSRYRTLLPFRDERRLAIVLDGLHKAGLPES
jgi:TolB-like protein/class 3 adenylate cyclase/Tfp pilus assembly protein PilF